MHFITNVIQWEHFSKKGVLLSDFHTTTKKIINISITSKYVKKVSVIYTKTTT